MTRRFLLILAGLIIGATTANAHPHVWLKARAELIFDKHTHLIAVHHAWEFDEGFSAFATQGLDENGDGIFSREELAELSKVNIESLSEFEYFTYVQMGGKDPKYSPPKNYWLEHKNGLLTLFFTLPIAEPVAPDPLTGFQNLTVEVFDPTFFVDVQFSERKPVSVSSSGTLGKSTCTATLQRRKKLDVFQSKLLSQIGPDQQVPEDIAPQQGELSNTIRVTCPTS